MQDYQEEHNKLLYKELKHWLEVGIDAVIEKTNILNFLSKDKIQQHKQDLLEYYELIPSLTAGGLDRFFRKGHSPSAIAAYIILESLKPEGHKHLKLYGDNGSPILSLISILQLGKLMGIPKLTRPIIYDIIINSRQIPHIQIDIDEYNKYHYLRASNYRHIEEYNKCPHCGKYI